MALAVDDAHAAAVFDHAAVEEGGQRNAGFVAGVAVQVEFALDDPAAAPQFPERGGGHAGAREEQFLAGGDGGFPVPRVGQGVDQDLLLVGPPLMGDGFGARARDVGAVRWWQRNGVGDGTPEQHGAVGRGLGLCGAWCSVAGWTACSRSARRTRASASNEAGASALRLRFISLGLAERVQVALGIERGHAAGAGAGDGLAVDVVLHVAGGEHAGDVGGGGVALVAALGDDVAAFQCRAGLRRCRCWACGRWR